MSHPPGRLVVSLDFELHWGVRDAVSLGDYAANLYGAREVIPRLLELFEQRGIRATWATVGFLFARDRDELRAAVPPRLPRYDDLALSPYGEIAELGAGEDEDPLHFAPSLIERIKATPGQELGSHTFSHFYALEPCRDEAAFTADLDAALDLARRHDITLTSLVFPRNQVAGDYLALCRARGFSAYRGNERAFFYSAAPARFQRRSRRALRLIDAYLPVLSHHLQALETTGDAPPFDVASSRFLRPYDPRLRWLEPLRLNRIALAMTAAARSGRTFHLWWHPHNFGVHQEDNLRFLSRILDHFEALRARHGMVSCNMADVASERAATLAMER